jgi:hypothetical protein
LTRACAAPLAVLVLVLSGCAGDQPDNAAFDRALSDAHSAEVTVRGTVTAVLGDATGPGATHERFRVDVDGHVVEVDHNLSLAPRVPVVTGSLVIIHGQFEPDQGHPVIHYTHHATGGHQGGWIELDGRQYS